MYIYGKNVCEEQLVTSKSIKRAYLAKNFKDENILSLLKAKHIKITYLEKNILDKKVGSHHQGIILERDDFETMSLDDFLGKIKNKSNPLVVMLDHLEDPHNFGAIIRTAEALGADGIIIPNDRSVSVSETVIKTSAGACFHLPIVSVPNLTSTIQKLKKNNFWIYGTDMEGTNYTKLDYNTSVCLVIGNEGHGLSKIIRDNCDYIASIPMKGKINSLNASVSCAIILSEIVKGKSC